MTRLTTLLITVLLAFGVAGMGLANDRIGDFSDVVPTQAEMYDGQELAEFPVPEPTSTAEEFAVELPTEALEANG